MDPLDLISQGKIKRFFRATRKLTQPGVISHITQRAAGKEPLFLEDDDYLVMLGLLKKAAEELGIRIFAFCLMGNHLHLLAKAEEGNLNDAMRNTFSQYAGRFNRKYGRRGHLFAGRYRQAVCLDPTYLLAVSLYIHLNPVRAGLVDDPFKYRWSSVLLYNDSKAPKAFVDPGFVLNLLSEDRPGSVKRYRRLLERGAGIESGHVLEQQDAIDRFRAMLVSMFPGLFKRMVSPIHVARISSGELLNLEELERRIEAVKDNHRRKPETQAAKRFLIEQLISRGFKRSEIAQRLQMSPKTIYNLLKKSLPISAPGNFR